MFTIPEKFSGFKGYTSSPQNADPSYLSVPSENCLVTDDGIAESRLGYTPEFSIGVDASPATAFYLKTYDLAFFALSTKVYYRDFTNNLTVDTGITLTTGTTTRFTEVLGDVILTNTTDGVYMIRCMRLNDAAANSGDATVTIDQDGASRISVYSDIAAGGSADDLRINGTNEQMASLVVSTGVVTLSGTLSQSYNDNAIAIVVRQYPSLDKFSKMLLWKWRLHGMGFPSTTNADQPNNTVLSGQFVAGNASAGTIEDIINFSLDGTKGSVKILVYGGGKVTNILEAKEFMWFFTEDKVFNVANSDVSIVATDLGNTRPDLFDELDGCLNEDSAIVMGDNAITYVTNKGRIKRIPIDTDNGAALQHAEEDFDVGIKEHLINLSKDQTGAFVYHYRGGRQTIYQLKESGQWKWFIYDHNIIRQVGSNFVRGTWQPPQRTVPVKNLFERNGVLYGTDMGTDTVYSFFTAFVDHNSPINTTIATGEFNVGSSMMKKASVRGDISYPSKIRIQCHVWNKTLGKRSGSEKIIVGSNYTYSEDESVGAVAAGESGVGETIQTAKWEKDFDIFPSEATTTQLVLKNYDGGYISLSAYSLSGERYSRSFSPSL